MVGREENIRLVVDTNILISALMRDDTFHAELIKSGYFELYYPDYGMAEIEKYKDYMILKRAKRGDQLALDYALKFIGEFEGYGAGSLLRFEYRSRISFEGFGIGDGRSGLCG